MKSDRLQKQHLVLGTDGHWDRDGMYPADHAATDVSIVSRQHVSPHAANTARPAEPLSLGSRARLVNLAIHVPVATRCLTQGLAAVLCCSLLAVVVSRIVDAEQYPSIHSWLLWLHPGVPSSLVAWSSTLAILASAVLLVCITVANRRSDQPFTGLWALLSVVFIILALDHIASPHRPRRPIAAATAGTLVAPHLAHILPGGFATGVVGLLYVPLFLRLNSASRRFVKMAIAVGVMAAAAWRFSDLTAVSSSQLASAPPGALPTMAAVLTLTAIVMCACGLITHLGHNVREIRIRVT